MKKFRRILLITIFIPTFVFASFSDGFNSLLNKFFGDKESPAVEKKVEISRDLPEAENLTEFRKEIQDEESFLENIENELYESQEKLAQIITERNAAEHQLQFLDQDISLSQQKIEKFRSQKEKWKNELEKITRQKSEIEAEIRVTQTELQRFLSKKFIQDEGLGSGDDVSVFRWLFSRKTVSQILEERMQKRQFEEKQKQKLNNLRLLQKKLSDNELSTAKIFHRVKKLSQRESDQKRLLTELADAKARVIARNEFSQGELEKQIIEARKFQAESTIVLQNLRLGMKEFAEFKEYNPPTETDEKDVKKSTKLAFPLKIPRKITATFKDPNYKQVMGREHWGVDFRAPQGTEIFAPADGIVKKVAQNGYNYSYLIIDHGDDLFTVYGHISKSFVQEGDRVKTGDKIALTGGTPGMVGSGYFTTGPHLHLEVFKDGKHVDPLDYLED
jgi:murein DD-endopeptidase MepM/ murein hydrolase activator NlpD